MKIRTMKQLTKWRGNNESFKTKKIVCKCGNDKLSVATMANGNIMIYCSSCDRYMGDYTPIEKIFYPDD